MKIRNRMKRVAVIALLLAIGISLAAPLCVRAQEADPKTVRVGWYESTYCYRDSYGRRRGMAYEYLASGCACFEPAEDKNAHRVLERADEKMYLRKKQMKEAGR